ncbi:hypothetical protein ACFOWE_31170, partial [Planomonospora corallina]
AAAAAATEAEFVRRLKGGGVRVRPRYAAGGRGEVVGYAVALETTSAPKALWFDGGRLAADLTLPRLRAGWRDAGAGEALAEWSHPVARGTRRAAPRPRSMIRRPGVAPRSSSTASATR